MNPIGPAGEGKEVQRGKYWLAGSQFQSLRGKSSDAVLYSRVTIDNNAPNMLST